ncbi:hypothetical protein BDN72DRAFT_906612 [Pluteus cervinus]|uniref:Uncharacterized protein n=1 Tax=Pluteus cervinus TaxID=181527 RepID=A0ACD2ZYV1_9AGAR|nr:hypothetical protein BDN72DRAFT_906612 [Pluteus cervinus]
MGLGEGVAVDFVQHHAAQTLVQPQDASTASKVAHVDASDASKEHGQTSNLAAMDVDPPNTKQDSEQDAVQDGDVSKDTQVASSGVSSSAMRGSQQESSRTDSFNDKDGVDSDDFEAESDEDTDDDDEESELSEGEDLRDDVNSALSELDYQGTYAIAKAFSFAPNPWLTIEGLGTIGLPLSDIDAKRIISASRQAPYGHGNATLVNIDVRNTWEVSSQSVSFRHSDWDTFLKKDVLTAVRDGLGLTVDVNTLRCQLHKLLLYEPGSHFLPHRDTPKVDGMFATVVIILPSYYTGGEVHVSHSTDSKVLSLPPDSFFQTSVLACQARSMLALSYNLIHTVPNQPTLTLPPVDEKIGFLRRILEKWRRGKYNNDEDFGCQYRLLGVLLDHEYSPQELGWGSNALKGSDAHIIANLRPVAEEMGFVLLLTSLTYTVLDHSIERGGDGSQDRGIEISNVVDLNGGLVVGSQSSSTTLHLSQLVPKDAFEGIDPDGEEGSDYMGNEEAPLEQWYCRTALIILQRSWKLDFFLSAGGLSYTVSKLKKVNPLVPTKAELRLANKAVTRLTSYTPSEWDEMVDISLSWKKIELWKAICMRSLSPSSQEIRITLYTKALDVFGFTMLQSMQELLTQVHYLSQRFELIRCISAHMPQDDSVSDWCITQRLKALGTIRHLSDVDIPLIMELIGRVGLSKMLTSIFPFLQKSLVLYNVWSMLLTAIRESIVTNSSGQSDDWKELIPQYLNGAIMCWIEENSTLGVGRIWQSHQIVDDPRIRSSSELIDLVIFMGYPDLTSKILDALLSIKGFVLYQFKYLHSPFIPVLRQLLAKHSLSLTTTPFSNFAQSLIGIYLRDMLCGTEPIIQTMVGKLGCSAACNDCRALDAFMMSSDREYRLCVDKQRQHHIMDQIGSTNGKYVVEHHTSTIGNSTTLVVVKMQEIVDVLQWSTRQANAQAFLKSFGGGNVITQLMGNRTADVTMALKGTQAFQWVEPSSNSTGSSGALASTSGSADQASAQPSSFLSSLPGRNLHSVNTSTPIVAGQKRKREVAVSQGPIIDLTLDSE